MATRDRIEELKQLTADLEVIDKAEQKAADAKQAYKDDPSEKTKAAHRKASQALADAREKVRGEDASRVVVPGDVSITPASVGNAKE
jgi:hypothetical protein